MSWLVVQVWDSKLSGTIINNQTFFRKKRPKDLKEGPVHKAKGTTWPSKLKYIPGSVLTKTFETIVVTSNTIIYLTLCESILITLKFLHENDYCSVRCCILCTDIFVQVNCGWNGSILFKDFVKLVSNLVVGGMEMFKEVFKEFIAVSLILILFNVNINIKIEIFIGNPESLVGPPFLTLLRPSETIVCIVWSHYLDLIKTLRCLTFRPTKYGKNLMKKIGW